MKNIKGAFILFIAIIFSNIAIYAVSLDNMNYTEREEGKLYYYNNGDEMGLLLNNKYLDLYMTNTKYIYDTIDNISLILNNATDTMIKNTDIANINKNEIDNMVNTYRYKSAGIRGNLMYSDGIIGHAFLRKEGAISNTYDIVKGTPILLDVSGDGEYDVFNGRYIIPTGVFNYIDYNEYSEKLIKAYRRFCINYRLYSNGYKNMSSYIQALFSNNDNMTSYLDGIKITKLNDTNYIIDVSTASNFDLQKNTFASNFTVDHLATDLYRESNFSDILLKGKNDTFLMGGFKMDGSKNSEYGYAEHTDQGLVVRYYVGGKMCNFIFDGIDSKIDN